MYASGVLFSLQSLTLTFAGKLHITRRLAYLLQINPAAVYITLVRWALLDEVPRCAARRQAVQPRQVPAVPHLPGQVPELQRVLPPDTLPSIPSLWICGVGWAVVMVVIGFLFFWRAEARYGRG